MKTMIENTTANIAIYGLLILMISGIAFGAEIIDNNSNRNAQQVELIFEDEEYIDDIPFDTEAIVEAYNYNQSLDEEYEFTDEAYVDDIPFNTNKIAYEYTETYASVK